MSSTEKSSRYSFQGIGVGVECFFPILSQYHIIIQFLEQKEKKPLPVRRCNNKTIWRVIRFHREDSNDTYIKQVWSNSYPLEVVSLSRDLTIILGKYQYTDTYT